MPSRVTRSQQGFGLLPVIVITIILGGMMVVGTQLFDLSLKRNKLAKGYQAYDGFFLELNFALLSEKSCSCNMQQSRYSAADMTFRDTIPPTDTAGNPPQFQFKNLRVYGNVTGTACTAGDFIAFPNPSPSPAPPTGVEVTSMVLRNFARLDPQTHSAQMHVGYKNALGATQTAVKMLLISTQTSAGSPGTVTIKTTDIVYTQNSRCSLISAGTILSAGASLTNPLFTGGPVLPSPQCTVPPFAAGTISPLTITCPSAPPTERPWLRTGCYISKNGTGHNIKASVTSENCQHDNPDATTFLSISCCR